MDAPEPEPERELEPPVAAEPAPPPLSPFATLSTRPTRVAATAFDVLAQASGDLRRASFYVGLVVLVLSAPLAIVVWRLIVQPIPFLSADEGAYAFLVLVAVGGLVLATIESRAIAVSLLAARLAGRPLELRAAVQRSRTIFWRLTGVLALTNVPLLLVQTYLEARMAELFGGESEPSVISAAILAAVVFSPLTYVVTAVVLGDVGAWRAVRSSTRLFRRRKLTGVVVALFEFGAQLLTAFGLLAGLDLVLRGAEATGVSAGSDWGAALTVGLIVILLFAAGSLVFTVAAVAIAPQVVAFLGLTDAAPGLDRIGGDGTRFRWLTRPVLLAMALAALAMYRGLSAFG